ncbi:helix-turn-helix transcriptional regulator [Streptomyces sp. NPDC127108]|uniref:helix-turn-helix transcriptional regulator n=1 Tax=Streptomyces sp. NPDC127108 TaxID=3345361 RepID=UPI00363AB760
MDRNTALGEFLRSRRARITPHQAGLSDDGASRRVPGLRREEVAQLAGVSVDYYVRLERGRRLNVSETVLDAISRALRLDSVERTHLFQLAKPAAGKPRRTATRPQPVRPGLRDLLRILDHTPALVLGRRLDVLASNQMARALLTDFEVLPHREWNLVRFMFGPLTLNYESLTLPADQDQRLSVYTAEAGSSSEEALRLLAAWIRQPETSHGQRADH